jgi:hypothetical protein
LARFSSKSCINYLLSNSHYRPDGVGSMFLQNVCMQPKDCIMQQFGSPPSFLILPWKLGSVYFMCWISV